MKTAELKLMARMMDSEKAVRSAQLLVEAKARTMDCSLVERLG